MTDEEMEAAEAEYMKWSQFQDPWPRDANGRIVRPPSQVEGRVSDDA